MGVGGEGTWLLASVGKRLRLSVLVGEDWGGVILLCDVPGSSISSHIFFRFSIYGPIVLGTYQYQSNWSYFHIYCLLFNLVGRLLGV